MCPNVSMSCLFYKLICCFCVYLFPMLVLLRLKHFEYRDLMNTMVPRFAWRNKGRWNEKGGFQNCIEDHNQHEAWLDAGLVWELPFFLLTSIWFFLKLILSTKDSCRQGESLVAYVVRLYTYLHFLMVSSVLSQTL